MFGTCDAGTLADKQYIVIIITLQYDDSRIIGIEMQSNDFTLLFLTVYLPYECDMYHDDYGFYLNKLQCIIDFANTPYNFILGDFNTDIPSTIHIYVWR